MISHYLTQIYQQQVLNEAASIPDDIKKAMVDNLDNVNRIFYRYSSDIMALLSNEPLPESTYMSTTTVEYACTYALRVYKNIDVAAQDVFQKALDSLKEGTDNKFISWWGYSGTVEKYLQYCERFNKKPVIIEHLVLQLLQSNNVEAFKKIGKWDAASASINKYLSSLKEFDGQFEPLIKKTMPAIESIDDASIELLNAYYTYYARTMHRPCAWIDEIICKAPREIALKIFRRISWTREGVAPAEQQNLYSLGAFWRRVCGKELPEYEA